MRCHCWWLRSGQKFGSAQQAPWRRWRNVPCRSSGLPAVASSLHQLPLEQLRWLSASGVEPRRLTAWQRQQLVQLPHLPAMQARMLLHQPAAPALQPLCQQARRALQQASGWHRRLLPTLQRRLLLPLGRHRRGERQSPGKPSTRQATDWLHPAAAAFVWPHSHPAVAAAPAATAPAARHSVPGGPRFRDAGIWPQLGGYRTANMPNRLCVLMFSALPPAEPSEP